MQAISVATNRKPGLKSLIIKFNYRKHLTDFGTERVYKCWGHRTCKYRNPKQNKTLETKAKMPRQMTCLNWTANMTRCGLAQKYVTHFKCLRIRAGRCSKEINRVNNGMGSEFMSFVKNGGWVESNAPAKRFSTIPTRIYRSESAHNGWSVGLRSVPELESTVHGEARIYACQCLRFINMMQVISKNVVFIHLLEASRKVKFKFYVPYITFDSLLPYLTLSLTVYWKRPGILLAEHSSEKLCNVFVHFSCSVIRRFI